MPTITQALTAAAQVTRYPTLMALRDGVPVYSEAGALAAGALEDLVQRILWFDMDRVRRELAQRADDRQPAAAGGAETVRRAGLASTAPRYGWPGL
ncbi:hypothetical protein [Nocardia niwae]|uniref:hypothetical protein n=1 Tax=Nocardia niwae TaxID=626084 RepID=UPI0012F49B59|nr:hypothetical protein [Nocardia niwae]